MSDSDSELSDYESKPKAKLFNKKKPSFEFESSSDEEDDEDMIVNKIAPYKRFLGVDKSDSDDDSVCLEKERDSKRAKCDGGLETKKQVTSFGIKLDIDSDDDDFEIKESDAMRKAREAREALLTNKATLSIDLDDDVVDEIEPIELPSAPSKIATKPLPPTGPLIQLELRANVKAAKNHSANKLHLKCTQLSMRLGTTVKQAKELYRQKLGQNLSENSTVKFMFDGYEMKDSKTLRDYELECDDLIDATITIEATKSASRKKKVCSHVDKFVNIKTTIKGGDEDIIHTYQLKLHDPFSKLIISHRDQHGYSLYKRISLEYNGKPVDPERTPYDLHKRKNTFEIEIVDEALRVKQVQHLKPSSNDTEGVFHENHGGILIKLRINGDNNDMHNIYIRRTEKFQILMNSFYKKYGLEEIDCKFMFDGCTLNTQGTVEDETLEGEEVFDVIIDKARWEKIKKLQKNADVLENRADHILKALSGKLVNDPPIQFLNGTNKDSELRKLQIKGDLCVDIASQGRYIHITNIRDKSHESFFRVGDRITFINSVKIEDVPCDQISTILKTGTNIIELQYFDLSLLQGTTSSNQIRKILVRGKLGVTIVNVGKYIRISRINIESRKEFFRMGDKLVSVNGKQVFDIGPNEFKNLLRDDDEGNVLEVQFVGVQDLPKPENRLQQSENTNANAEQIIPLKEIYEIQVLRNNNPQKKRKFRIYANGTLSILRKGYLKKYSQKGCLTVKFYYNGFELDDRTTIQSLRYNENDFIIAMENGASL